MFVESCFRIGIFDKIFFNLVSCMKITTEKWGVCLKCLWIPKTTEDQSTICPKCGNECVQRYFNDKRELKSWQELQKRSNILYI